MILSSHYAGRGQKKRLILQLEEFATNNTEYHSFSNLNEKLLKVEIKGKGKLQFVIFMKKTYNTCHLLLIYGKTLLHMAIIGK
jgi:hypothetical protein